MGTLKPDRGFVRDSSTSGADAVVDDEPSFAVDAQATEPRCAAGLVSSLKQAGQLIDAREPAQQPELPD